MKQSKVTPFQQRVYDAVSQVPTGKVTTYALLARSLSCQSAQAVGQALKRNPFAPEVPCHRVIKSDLSLGGYVGQVAGEQIEKKRHLLQSEGVYFSPEGKLKNSELVYDFCS